MTHQITINLPYSPGKCLFLFICVGLPLFLFLEAFISTMINLWSKELDDEFSVEKGFVKYHFKEFVGQQKHQCDGRIFKCMHNVYTNKSTMIPYSRRCDGVPDCLLGDDEFGCKKCQTSFSCPSHDNSSLICLRSTSLCNDYSDCPRGEDENLPECKFNSMPYERVARLSMFNQAEPNGGCREDEFNCQGMRCIPKELVCNGEDDCNLPMAPFDEMNCKECQGGAQYCQRIMPISNPSSNPFEGIQMAMNCLPPWKLCDGIHNCADYSDEDFKQCDKLEGCPGACNLNQTGMTKKEEYANKGIIYLGDDESENFAEHSQFTHLAGQKNSGKSRDLYEHKVLCQDGNWLNKWIACSGNFPNCEEQCEKCTLGAFKCKSEQKCLKSGLICDGFKDCKDGSDEEDCQQVTKNCNDTFRRCNGYTDCDDGRDEKNCPDCYSNRGTTIAWMKLHYSPAYAGKSPGTLDYHKGFHCSNDSQCISFLQRCDGVVDCPSGEDEEKCSCYECLMHPQRMYICQEGWRCFEWDKVCEGPETRCPNATELDKQYCLNRTLGFSE